jgi:hypothetical protein
MNPDVRQKFSPGKEFPPIFDPWSSFHRSRRRRPTERDGRITAAAANPQILPLEFLLGDDPVHGSLSGWIAEW